MPTQHKDLTEANLHETKGVSTASANSVHVCTTPGVSSWGKVRKENLDTTSIKDTNLLVLVSDLEDISTASKCFVTVPFNGVIKNIYLTISAVVTGSNTVVTSKIGSTPLTNGTITVTHATSTEGSIYSCTPTANNTITAGTALTLECDGASSNVSKGVFTIVIELT